MKIKPSKLGIVTLIFGLSGVAFALLLMWWTMSVDYPMVIGGKPYFSLPAFIPVTFELQLSWQHFQLLLRCLLSSLAYQEMIMHCTIQII